MNTCKRCGKESEMPFHTCVAKPTDDQLKQALAKMLPERVEFPEGHSLRWKLVEPIVNWNPAAVLDTELLYICWMVECGLTWNQKTELRRTLNKVYALSDCLSSDWQQRTIALAKVKGIEL